MIIHVHYDGSEGFEYELGDSVEITGVIGSGAWFQRVIGRTGTIVAFGGRKARRSNDHWRTCSVDVRHSDDWGPSGCMPWQVKPTPETYAKAKRIDAALEKLREAGRE